MKCRILSRHVNSENKECLLCETTLIEYMNILPDNFYDFNIQRRIVKNGYLDKLYKSIENGEPFLPITLISLKDDEGDNNEIILKEFHILDGLQRTFRLWVPFVLSRIIAENDITDYRSLTKFIDDKKTELSSVLDACGFVSTKFKKLLFESRNNELYVNALMHSYETFPVYFYVWKGLDDADIVEKMLILNAGQKPVQSTHQFELLFLQFFENLSLPESIKLVRAKDKEYTSVVRGDRNPQTFSMASVIIGLKSYVDGRQQRIAPANLISIDEINADYDNLSVYFNKDFLSSFIETLADFDKEKSDDPTFVKWFSKDTTISGLFGAVGNSIDISSRNDISILKNKLKDLQSKDFMLSDFENEYKHLSSVNTNVGNAVREAIFNYTTCLLNGLTASWNSAFNRKK